MQKLSVYLSDPIARAFEQWAKVQGNRSKSDLAAELIGQAVRNAAKAGIIQIYERSEFQHKTLPALIVHNQALLEESGKFASGRVSALMQGEKPTEIEVLRIALILGLTEEYVSTLPINGEIINGNPAKANK